MMDDIFFSDPVKCFDCGTLCDLGLIIWVNGKCSCPECYEKKRKEKEDECVF